MMGGLARGKSVDQSGHISNFKPQQNPNTCFFVELHVSPTCSCYEWEQIAINVNTLLL